MSSFNGQGCTSRIDGLPVHNPEPRTARGKRRHVARNDAETKHAQAAWQSGRTDQMSRHQKLLETGGKRRGR